MKRLFVLWCHWWSELSPKRNKGRVIWLRSLGSCRGFEKAACLGSRYIDNHTQLYRNLDWARYLIQYWGQMTAKLAQFKMFCCVSWEKWWNWEKATCKLCQTYANSFQTCYKLYTYWIPVQLLGWTLKNWRLYDSLSVLFKYIPVMPRFFSLGRILPYLCFWMFFRMWKTGKLTGKLSCRYSGCQRKWNKSRQDMVPQDPSLSHVIKTVKICMDPAFITVAWNFHWNKISNSLAFPHIHMMVLPLALTMIVIYHWQLVFPPVLCLWLLCFHGFLEYSGCYGWVWKVWFWWSRWAL